MKRAEFEEHERLRGDESIREYCAGLMSVSRYYKWQRIYGTQERKVASKLRRVEFKSTGFVEIRKGEVVISLPSSMSENVLLNLVKEVLS
jgi:hypothetical protein